MHLCCPHCQGQIEIVDLNDSKEIECPSCGSSFRMEGGSTSAWSPQDGTLVIGRFQVIDTLGSGSFGTVYLAYDSELDRQVAVKVPRSGNLSTDQERDRFLREARSAAQLCHDSIVTMHEVGLHEGNPYLVSEVVQGMTLADMLTGRRPAPRESVELIATVSEALHHAHQQGVIHRDIKPSNIMLDDKGKPYIMDFGLAKRDAGEITMTVEGQILGTPAYMSPEQAFGESHQVDARSDVYSLGVVLYLLLTGELPFRGNQRMLLHQVRNDEPKPPRKLNDLISRDLETICLRCMEKEPSRRYANAQALAEDLQRFLSGEPILARPAGRIERIVKWARRKPTQAALLVTVTVILLLLGVGGPLIAFREAGLRQDAEMAKKEALDQKHKATSLAEDLQKSVDSLLTATARSLGRPLAAQGFVQLSEIEIRTLLELAQTTEEPLRLKFVQETLRNPLATNQLRNRADYALVAAVGLDLKRRAKVRSILVTSLIAANLTEEQRIDVVLTVAELGVITPVEAEQFAQILLKAMDNKTTPLVGDLTLLRSISEVSQWMEPKSAAPMLLNAISRTRDHIILLGPFGMRGLDAADVLLSLSEGLSSVAQRMETKKAMEFCAKVAPILLNMLGKVTDYYVLSSLSENLSSVAQRMEPKDAVQTLLLALTTTSAALKKRQGGLRLYPRYPPPLQSLGKGLSTVAQQMDPKEVAQILLDAMSKNSDIAYNLSGTLLAVTQRMEPKVASQMLLDAISRNPLARHALSGGLLTVALRMAPKEAAQMLINAMSETKNPLALRSLLVVLSEVAQGMEPKEAAKMLINRMSKNPDVADFLSRGLSAVAHRMEPKEAAAACSKAAKILLQAMSENPLALDTLSRGLSAVAQRMEPKEAAQMLINALSETTPPFALSSLSEGLSAVAMRMESKEAAAACSKATKILLQKMSENPLALDTLSVGLSAVARRMEPKDAAEACSMAAKILLQAMSEHPDAATVLSRGLSAVAERMEPQEAAQLLINTMRQTTHFVALSYLSPGLLAVAQRMEPKVVAQMLSNVMSKLTDPAVVSSLSVVFLAVAKRMARKEAAEACSKAAQLLTNTMGNNPDFRTLSSLSPALLVVAQRMEPKEAAEACSKVAQLLINTMRKSPIAAHSLSRNVSAVAQRMERKEGAEVCLKAAQILFKTMGNLNDVPAISRDLSAVAQRMERKEAVEVCSKATQRIINAMSRTTSALQLENLSKGLQAVLEDSSSDLLFRTHSLTSVFGHLSSHNWITATAVIAPAIKPFPCRLTTPRLVELLKNPLCVGKAERVVLDQLENRYGHNFQTRWHFVKYATDKGFPLDFKSPLKVEAKNGGE